MPNSLTQNLSQNLGRMGLLSILVLSPNAFSQQQAGAASGNDVTTESFQDWEVRCQRNAAGPAPCAMSQLVTQPDSDQPLMQVILDYPPQIDDPVMSFFVPLGVRLAPGLQFSVDNGEPIQFPYQVCQEQGCRADVPIESSMLQQLRSGNTATLSMISPRGERMDIDISLIGFTDASARIAP
ncbi:invasion associated locus B family protein [Halomonas sp. ISL-60]|uniref:invasion associated locus B family protein n=1 Tax=Halomonas sp. ISL-56 TaxID=2819149 RepID=UPI001BEC0EA7|nr:invasion associated locus B family protein [Halomonas sp. ISL-56]MBT2773641.1 invasion associated locus B family protein [Halomonas sp. ISL-60]MBT2802074.1 invasion associated locus B family protein [Halomonas sp. ISL-56]